MEKKIVKDILFLSQVSQPASQEDLYLARDLQGTLLENRETCVGLAANMTGVRPTTRYETITVSYRDRKWQEQTITLTGFSAQICQHELDHLEGRII